jgi:NAD(P)-dependent dehydrogenase (short-subunit alcohol dehydrogenase family)
VPVTTRNLSNDHHKEVEAEMHINELFSLEGKVALVTGGGRGLGENMAIALAEAGADIALCSRTLANCEEVAKKIEALGRKALPLACDIRNPQDVQQTVDQVLHTFGQIDILINNSGAVWGAAPEDMPLEAWNKVMETNVTGIFLMSQAVGKHMIQRKFGRIINIASIAAYVSLENTLGYNTSKGAVVSFTIDLANTWAKHNITVNAIAPGFFPTKMSQGLLDEKGDEFLEQRIPLGRFGSSDDIKGAAVYLASGASSYVTGQTLVIDGGWLTR